MLNCPKSTEVLIYKILEKIKTLMSYKTNPISNRIGISTG